MITYVNDSNFDEEVINSNVPVLVDFSADWCGACQRFEPTLEHISRATDGEAKVCLLDTDQSKSFVRRYHIRALPTILIFQGGQEVSRTVGGRGAQFFIDIIRVLSAHTEPPAEPLNMEDYPNDV